MRPGRVGAVGRAGRPGSGRTPRVRPGGAMRAAGGRPAVDPAEVRALVQARIGGVTAPEEVLVWDDLARSEVGKVVGQEVRAQLLRA